MHTPFSPCDGLVVLPSSEPVPGLGLLPVNAFLIRGPAPLLVDCGMGREQAAFLDALETVVDPSSLAGILLTHEDADHSGSLNELLERAPGATLYTTLPGMGKLGAGGPIPPQRVQLLAPGSGFTAGGRRFRAVRPPMYDSPATLAFLEEEHGWLFASDALSAFLPAAPEWAEDLDPTVLADGMSLHCRMNSPWLADIDRGRYAAAVRAFAALDPELVLATHLPPLRRAGFRRLIDRALRLPDEGVVPLPDQAAFAQIMASLSPAA